LHLISKDEKDLLKSEFSLKNPSVEVDSEELVVNPNHLPQAVIDEVIGNNDEEVVSTNEEDAIVNDGDANTNNRNNVEPHSVIENDYYYDNVGDDITPQDIDIGGDNANNTEPEVLVDESRNTKRP
jgi:hypothetical protein